MIKGKYYFFLTKDFLHKEYTLKKRSINALSKELKIKRDTIRRYLVFHGIPFHDIKYEDRKCYRNANWKGHGEIPFSYWSNVLRNAKACNRKCSISIQDAWNLYLSQNGKCALSGLPIGFPRARNVSASLDRIDSTKDMKLVMFNGYIKL